MGGPMPSPLGGGAGGRCCVSPFASSAFTAESFDSMFVWNSYLARALRQALGGNSLWMVALIHGFWDQRRLSGARGC